MSLFSKWFGIQGTKPQTMDIPAGMECVRIKQIGMHCVHACKPAVEGALRRVPGVHQFVMEVSPGDHAWVIYDPHKTTVDAISQSIVEAGYQVREVQVHSRPGQDGRGTR